MKYRMFGVIPPMITPFTRAGDVDEEALKKLVSFLDDKVHGVFICGSYGSGPLMNVSERKRVAEIVRSTAKALQVIVMTGTANTRDTIELTLHARDIGCDAASAVAPYYFHHNMGDVLLYYKDILDAVGVEFPFYIYTNPKFSGYAVDLDTMKRLQAIGLNGVKAASFDIMEFANYKRAFQEDEFDVVLGTEALWLPASAYGAKAFIPGLANAFPEICQRMFQLSQDGDLDGCRQTQYEVNAYRDIMYLAGSTQMAVYAMLELRGVLQCYPRKPFQAATESQKRAIEEKLKELKAI